MAAKVDTKVLKRLLELHGIGLTQSVIGQRLGLSTRTVRLYISQARKEQECSAHASPNTD